MGDVAGGHRTTRRPRAPDLATGQVWPQSALDYTEEPGKEEDNDPDRWLWVHCEGSRNAYQDMVWFIEALDDPNLADRLGRAISGRGGFHRFKGALSGRPELMTRWHAYSSDRQRGRARSWLAARGFAGSSPRSPLAELLRAVLVGGSVTLCTQCAARRDIGGADV